MEVRTRFAPSPTGTPESIHLGFIIRALWSYAYAMKNGGKYILRLEDTDQKRSREDTERKIYEVLRGFGINHDEGPDVGGEYGPYKQSERLEIYQEYAHKLVELGAAYYDFDAEKREKEEIKAQYEDAEKLEKVKEKPAARNTDPSEAKKRVERGDPYVVRVKIPENKIFEYEDWILRKKVKIHSKEVSDLIILKSDGFPTYHLAVVVDDHLMKISHVFRGQEWISTTPIHLFLYDSLGWERPVIGHFTVIIDPRTNKKFSKRDMSGLFGVESWLSNGYLKEALLNYLMLLGWAPKDNRELFTLGEFVEVFDQSGIQKANPTFNVKKLDWFQGQYMRKLSIDQLERNLEDWYQNYDRRTEVGYLFEGSLKEKVFKALQLLQERSVTLKELLNELHLFFTDPEIYEETKDVKGLDDKSNQQMIDALEDLKQVLGINNQDEWVALIRSLAAKHGWKDADMFMMLRLAVWGKRFSPPLFEAIQLLQPENRVERINRLITALKYPLNN